MATVGDLLQRLSNYLILIFFDKSSSSNLVSDINIFFCIDKILINLQYAKAASILNHNDPPIILAKIDATDPKNRVLKKEFDIMGYPTIKIFKNGGQNVEDYEGSRDADGIVAYLKKQVVGSEIEYVDEESIQYNSYNDDMLSEV